MSYLAYTSSLQSTERVGQGPIRSEPRRQRSHTTSIHILDDYSLLNVFYHYRSAVINEDEDGVPVARGTRWDRGEWWYKLAHVCKRWRNLTLGSASYLELCLVCTPGKPVADMLAHSPPLPLVIDYDGENDDIDAEDEEGITLALEQRDRVRRVRLWMPVSKLQSLLLLMASVEEYPVLEYMIVGPEAKDNLALMLPGALQAPQLHHLLLPHHFPSQLRTPIYRPPTNCPAPMPFIHAPVGDA
ncbi:hypothetical protein BGY98DRAFT_943855 [Russula aff. rugulosa BPL654]|nr:hypothetical protein BGY98DRAFT_943855 [Russula aff. rugulosa BPL654]